MDYPERLVIRRPSGTAQAPTGEQNMNTGLWDDYEDEVLTKDTSVVCQTRCDAQDKPTLLQASAQGMPQLQFDVIVFLMIERVIDLIQVGDLCDLTWADQTTETLLVLKTSRLDGSVYLRRTGK